MERVTVQVGSFDVNCSMMSSQGKTWIIDPGQEAHRLISVMSKKKLTPDGILLTHAHFDHIGAIPGLQEAFPALPVYVHEKDIPVLTHALNAYPPDYPALSQPRNLSPLADLANVLDVDVLETPGHTPGGVCYYFPADKLLFSGDTLFAGSVGRTDLPGGDMATLMTSLGKLMALPDDTLVIPGHGPQTTIADEKRSNPFVNAI